MFAIVWYASGIQSVVLKEKYISIEFKILIFERIFLLKISEVTEGWIKLHSIEISSCMELRCRGLKSRRIRLARNVI